MQVGRARLAVGHDALRASFTEQLGELGVTILLVGNHVIDVIDDDHATGIVSCRGEIEMKDQWVVPAIQYHDTYERRDGTWLFVHHRHLLFYGADLLDRQIGLPPRSLAIEWDRQGRIARVLCDVAGLSRGPRLNQMGGTLTPGSFHQSFRSCVRCGP